MSLIRRQAAKSPQERLDQAKALIQAKDYAAARRILRTLDHPTAKAWLQKLDTIAPYTKAATSAPPILNYVIIGLICGLVGLVAGIVIGNTAASSSASGGAPALSVLNPCWKDDWWKQASPLVVQFLDTAETAGQTSRASLSGVILELRSIQREFEAVEYPDCVSDIYGDIDSGMRNAVDGFNSFLGQAEILASVELDMAATYLWNAHVQLKNNGIFADYRMVDASIIWGGETPNEATATAFANTSG